MFGEFANFGFSKVYLEFTIDGFENDLSKLEGEVAELLLSHNPHIEICEDEDSDAAFLFECMYFPDESDGTVEFTTVRAYLHMSAKERDKDDEEYISFEFNYQSKMTYEELLYSYRLLLNNIFAVINDQPSLLGIDSNNTPQPIPLKSTFTLEARYRWGKIPERAQKEILGNVFCGKCLDAVIVVLETADMEGENLILRGKCMDCGAEVCRVVEPESE